jgi:serine/threonine-protein kinase
MTRVECPDIRALEELLGADDVATDCNDLVRHLETCVDCQTALQTLAADPSDWDDAAHGLAGTTREEHVLRQLVEQLKDEEPERVEDLSFLRPAVKPGVLGMLGPYEVYEEIGRGGMGVVLRAFDPALNRVVAIKVLSPLLACSATARRRFMREAKAAAAVCHEHVVTVHAVSEVDGLPYIVMQYVAGESLQARLDRGGPLEVAEIVRIGLQTAEGLAAAHAQGLIHRDIKPANILLEGGEGSRVKITDFGLARTADDVQLTRDGVLAGTPEYMAPEQARGEPVDHRSDLFSLGSVLYALCTGLPPFRGPSTPAVLRQVSDDQPAPIRFSNPETPEWLEAFISRLLDKNPAGRFQSAVEVAGLLQRYLEHLSTPDLVPVPILPPSSSAFLSANTETSTSRRLTCKRPAILICALALSLAASLLFWLLAANGEPRQAAKTDGGMREQQHVVLDFREAIEKLPPCTLFGPEIESVVSTDAKGLRINRSSEHPNQVTGVDVPIVVRGDFDISLGYELLAIGKPLPKYGAGIGMRVMFGEPVSVTALLSRSRKPVGETLGAFEIVTDAEGKDRYKTSREKKATSSSGRLRLVRTGTTVQFLAADGSAEYAPLQSLIVGLTDVHLIRLYANSTDGRVVLDVRFTDLDIRADEIVRSTTETPTSPVGRGEPRSRGGLSIVLVLGLLLVVTLAPLIATWIVVRRRRTVEQIAKQVVVSDNSDARLASSSVSCEACGKKLKFKPDLAGKRIRCPACGEAFFLPGLVHRS